MASPLLRPAIDRSWEEDLIAEARDLRRANAAMQEEKVELKRQLSEKRPPVEYEPRKVVKKMRREGPDLRMSVADGNGLWEDHPDVVKESRYKCPFCAKRYSSKPSLSQHKYQSHNGVGNTPKMKLCNVCGFHFAVNNFKVHKCVKSGSPPT
jgi:hypothetical protein